MITEKTGILEDYSLLDSDVRLFLQNRAADYLRAKAGYMPMVTNDRMFPIHGWKSFENQETTHYVTSVCGKQFFWFRHGNTLCLDEIPF